MDDIDMSSKHAYIQLGDPSVSDYGIATWYSGCHVNATVFCCFAKRRTALTTAVPYICLPQGSYTFKDGFQRFGTCV
jgi:hypothetical protein